MIAVESYVRNESLRNEHAALYTTTVTERSLAVLVTSIQWCVAFSFLAAIISGGSWSISHRWLGFAVFILCLILGTAIHLLRRSGRYAHITPLEWGERNVVGNVSPGLQRRTGITLLVLIGITVISGWMYTVDFFWALVWIEDVHNLAAGSAAGLMILYGAMVLYFSHKNYQTS